MMKYNSCLSTFSLLFQILFTLFPVVVSSFHVKQAGPFRHSPRKFPRQSSARADAIQDDPTPQKITVTDESCKHTEKNIYEIEYKEEEIRQVSLFRKDFRLESYVGYPCSTKLYEKFEEQFRNKSLDCPFSGDLETRFQEFVWNNLSTTFQTNTSFINDTIDPLLIENSSILFQYICFSNQFEKCVFSQEKMEASAIRGYNGTCDGVCACMEQVPVEPRHYPQITNIDDNPPVLKIENDIRCGVQAGGLCFPVWDSKCKPNETDYNKTLETQYKKTDFLFKCESNAGCHTAKRICECAQGHTCGSSGPPFNNLFWFLFWIFTLI